MVLLISAKPPIHIKAGNSRANKKNSFVNIVSPVGKKKFLIKAIIISNAYTAVKRHKICFTFVFSDFFIFCCFNNKIQFNNHCRRFRQIRRRLSITAGVRGEKSPVEFLPNRLSVAGGAFLSVHSLPFFRGNEFLAEQEVGHVSDFPGQRIFHPAAVFLDLAQEVGQLAD